MPLADDYLKYPARRHGMDHDRYEWSHLFDRREDRVAERRQDRALGDAGRAMVSDRHDRESRSARPAD